jgi:hypothetical protein
MALVDFSGEQRRFPEQIQLAPGLQSEHSMELLRKISVYMWVAVGAAALYTGWVMWSRQQGARPLSVKPDPGQKVRDAELARVYGGADVRILQFYAREGSVTEGSKSAICYGVVNAKAVRLEPPAPSVFPSLNRCVEIAPARDTRYTLIAEGSDGRMVSESFLLGVKPDPETLPKITSFEIVERKPDYRGRMVYLISFAQQNGLEVSVDPPAFPKLQGTPGGRFYVAPPQTTTYTLTVTGKFGHRVQRQLTLDAR